MTRKMTTMSIAIVAVLGLSAVAMAHGWGGGYGGHMMGYGYGQMGPGNGFCPAWGAGGQAAQALTPEQQEKAQALWTDFQAKTEPVARELYAKNAELRAALAATDIDSGRVDSLAKDTAALRVKLLNERVALRKALRDAGLPAQGFGPGYGRGFRGHMGRGFGPGMMGNGYGMGPGMMGYGYGQDADES